MKILRYQYIEVELSKCILPQLEPRRQLNGIDACNGPKNLVNYSPDRTVNHKIYISFPAASIIYEYIKGVPCLVKKLEFNEITSRVTFDMHSV